MPGNLPRPVNAKWVPNRLSLLYVAFLVLAAAITIRLLNLGVARGSDYARWSENNFLRTRSIPAPRGTVYDRHGQVLAFNRSLFAISMSPGNLTPETILTSLDHLSRLLDGDFTGHYEAVAQLKPRWKSRLLSGRLTLDQATAVLEQRYNLPGIAVETRFQRHYPHGQTLCHVLGHVGKITKAMWTRTDQKYQRAGYELDDDVGIVGIEAAFEDGLRGQKGLEQIWKTGRGRILSSQLLAPTAPGNRLYLTIDLALQQLAEDLLRGRKGVILAADPRDGEILAWACSPGYDLNRPAQIDDPSSQPLLNRAIQEYYQPGSTFKVFTAIAALKAGWPADRVVTCEHQFKLPNWNRPFTCLGWHGPVDLRHAFQYSCNIYFYNMANFLYGLDGAGWQMVQTAERFGFRHLTHINEGVPGFEEKAGTLPRIVDLQRERGSVLHLAIGQGRVDVTPLQMLMAYSALANGGQLLVPRLVREMQTEAAETVFALPKTVRWDTQLHSEHRRRIIDGMQAAVYERGGTAYGANFLPEWRVAGKTSTAEGAGDIAPDAWFIGLAPADNPEIVVLVLVEETGHGGKFAAPLAARLFARYFERKATPPALAQR